MDFKQFCYLLSVLVVFNVLTLTEGGLIVKTSKGRVRGVSMDSKGNSSNKMNVFKGIPYAKPPTGSLRFKAPQEHNKWSGTKALSEFEKPFCPQNNLYGYEALTGYDEDCLYVNVYCPSTATSDSNLPVMVYIHGGDFVQGSGWYFSNGPDHLVDQNVIVVTMNYRLGALGFLSTGTEDAPGNAGLKDQSLALKWVQTEIKVFGGNPTNVTIVGQDAGSSSVYFHIISEMSKGLFQQAIAESGTALAERTFLKTGFEARAKQLAVALNCSTAGGDVDITCLQNAPVERILDQQDIPLSEEDTIPGNDLAFVPVLDTNATTTPFFIDTPDNLIKNPVNQVPMIIGTNQAEGISFVSTDADYYLNFTDKLKYFVPKSTRDLIDNYTLSDKVNKLKSFYLNNSDPTLDNLQGYVQLLTDKMFVVNTATAAKALSKYNKLYLYQFEFDGGFKFPNPKRELLKLQGAGHKDELGYYFITSLVNTDGYSESSPEMKMLRKMVKLWTNFIKYGTPTLGSYDPDLEDTQWISISENVTNYLNINSNLSMSTANYNQLSLDFWDDIDSTVNVSPTPYAPTTTTPTPSTTTSTATTSTTTPSTATTSTTTPPTTTSSTTTTSTTTPSTTTSSTTTTSTTTPSTTTSSTATTSTTTPFTTTQEPVPSTSSIPPPPPPSSATFLKFNIITFISTTTVIIIVNML